RVRVRVRVRVRGVMPKTAGPAIVQLRRACCLTGVSPLVQLHSYQKNGTRRKIRYLDPVFSLICGLF
ncbi:hypothetical protein, partial [Paenibacillus cucumis (ex Kampfer et al. 2016)]|uniref:hypothetical protein n=1 Tax=Paenibacillus cucumis (ex Kampfer et al. 2016) TaxID=1776858 RepID=UPI001C8E4A05